MNMGKRLISYTALLALLVIPHLARAQRWASDASLSRRAYWGLVRDYQDIVGNNDGIWENEDLARGERGIWRGGVEDPNADELHAWRTWKVMQLNRWGVDRVGTTGSEVVSSIALHTLVRYDRDPSSFTDGYLLTERVGRAPARHIYYQRWEAKGDTKVVTVLIPGYHECSTDWRHVIQRLNELGSRVYVIDPPGHGVSEGPRGDVKDYREWRNAYDAILARAHAENPDATIVAMGHSTGAGVIADDMHNRVLGQTHGPGPDAMLLSSPYLTLKDSNFNWLVHRSAEVSWNESKAVPQIGVLSEAMVGIRRAQWKKIWDLPRRVHFVREFSVMERRHTEWIKGPTGITIPLKVVQSLKDPTVSPKASEALVEHTPGAEIVHPDTVEDHHGVFADPVGFPILIQKWTSMLSALTKGKPDCGD